MSLWLCKKLWILPASFFAGSIYAQNDAKLISIEKAIQNGYVESSIKDLNKIQPKTLKKADQAFYNYIFGQAYEQQNKSDYVYSYYLKAKELYKAVDSLDKVAAINLDLAFLIDSQKNNTGKAQHYADEFLAYAKSTKDSKKLARAYAQLGSMNAGLHDQKSLYYFTLAVKQNQIAKDTDIEIGLNNNIAVLHNEYLNQPDSGLYYLKKNLPLIVPQQKYFELCNNYINQASSYHHKKDYKKAIEYLLKADSVPNKQKVKILKSYIYEFLSLNYKLSGNIAKAYDYQQLEYIYSDSIQYDKQNIAIADIQTRYETKEKELENKLLKKENKIIDNKHKASQNLFYGAVALLFISIVIAYLITQNLKRKQKISDQYKEIEKQKLDKQLGEMESSAIDLMLEGQEKERQRIANDLHDNLGSLLAALKLNFDNLRTKNSMPIHDKLYDKTDNLIQEAYQKVRSLAHAKNAGVIANQGLVPAVENLAAKVTIPGKFTVNIFPFGLDERIENTMEISIFRMIQELVTNIIKHAEATEANIHLTQHEDSLNIIIEDNGKGMDTRTILRKNGMGLKNIEKKVEHLDGTLTIEAYEGKGTSVVINIPL